MTIIRPYSESDAVESLRATRANWPLLRDRTECGLGLGMNGQIGKYLTPTGKALYGDAFIATDLRHETTPAYIEHLNAGVLALLSRTIEQNNVRFIINLVALLSKAAELFPELARKINEELPEQILGLSRHHGVSRVLMPSSIAVAIPGRPIVEGAPETFVAIDDSLDPFGKYGIAKLKLEKLAARYNALSQHEDDLLVLTPRLGGVLACNLPPSEGTTEELDKVIIAFAEYQARKAFGVESACTYSRAGTCHPKIAGHIKFPMVDARTVDREIWRMLHAPAKDIREHAAHFFLVEYTASIDDVAKILRSMDPGFKVACEEKNFDKDKMRFGEAWADYVDIQPSVNAWGFQPTYTLADSIRDQVERLTAHFKAQYRAEGLVENPRAGQHNIIAAPVSSLQTDIKRF